MRARINLGWMERCLIVGVSKFKLGIYIKLEYKAIRIFHSIGSAYPNPIVE